MTADDVRELGRCLAASGVAVFPADTVYGLACDPESQVAVERLYGIKGRPPGRPAAVMFFALARALEALPELGATTRAALERLLPGPVTVLLPNPVRRWLLACGPQPERLGIRVPALDGRLEPLRSLSRPVLQSSANRSGGRDPWRLAEIDASILAAVDLALDAGDLPGTPSTVVDLSDFGADGSFEVLREGALARADVARLLEA